MNIKCTYSNLVKITDLKPNPKNPNKHPDEQIEKLAKIIDYQGMRSPIVISTLSGLIVKGHGRLEAIKRLGWTEAPVDYQDYEDEAQEYADMVADNSLSEWSRTDFSMVNLDIQDFGPELDIEMLGMRSFEIEPFDARVMEINKGDESAEWADAGLEDFNVADKDIKLTIIFRTELEREVFVKEHNIEITNNNNGQLTSRRN